MFTKLLNEFWILLYFYVIVFNCQLLKSKSEISLNALNDSQRIIKQWNQWIVTQWNDTQWPQTNWNSSLWPGNQWLRPSTIQPWPTLSKPSNQWWPPINHKPTTSASITPNPSPAAIPPLPIVHKPITTTRSTTQKPSTFWPPTSSATTRPTTEWTPTSPTIQTNETFNITVKSCGLSHIPQELIGNKIVSGKVAKGGEFPWQVILKIFTARGPMQCGGAILNSRWVLTAAHCVSNERNGQPTAQRIDVTAGVHNRLAMSTGSQMRTADCVVQHEGWTGQYGKFKHDIALIRLPADKHFELSYEKGGHINGICLPTNAMSEYHGNHARIAGWGLTKDRGTPSDVLMYTDVTILSNEKCKTFPYPVPIADGMMCQGVDRTAPCQGDSGGPLIVSDGDQRGAQRMTEIGIVSFGPGECANAQTPNAIYTKVSHYLKWIEKTIKANGGQKCLARRLKSDNIDKIDDILEETTDESPQNTESNPKILNLL